MTLTGNVPARRHKTILAVLLAGFHRMAVEQPIVIDRLALLKQESPEASFRVVSESALDPGSTGRF
jgi:hypothetical protein